MTACEPLLQLESVTVDFPDGPAGTVHAVLPLDLEVRRGEKVGLIGASGGGKSLTAFAALGLAPRGARLRGGISIEGVDPRQPGGDTPGPIRGGTIALLPQEAEAALNPVTTIGAHLKETIRVHRTGASGRWRSLASELLASVGLGDPRILRSYPHQLSGGQRQRALLALALAGEPDLLVADEPTSSLDVLTQARILDLLDEHCRTREMALLLISHDLAVVAGLADRIVVMYAGRVVEEAHTQDLLAHPLHPYSRLLVEIAADDGPVRDRPLPVPPGPVRMNACPCTSFCPRVEAECRTEAPDLVEVAESHRVRCPPAARERQS